MIVRSLSGMSMLPRMGKGDWMPFGVMAIAVLLAVLLPSVMIVVACMWLVITIIGLVRTKFVRGVVFTWREAVRLFVAFNVATAVVLFIACSE